MNNYNIEASILPNYFLKEDGTFNLEDALLFCGKIAGICYDKDGYEHLKDEDETKTLKRVNMTLENGHHSVYSHVDINFYFKGLPKILAMVLNNEKEYATSEKSARYTPIVKDESSVITSKEESLYNEWMDILKDKIKMEYKDVFTDTKIKKLAQENARYMVTVFMPTEMVYTTSLRQINYIVSWMLKYIKSANLYDEFEGKLAFAMRDFILKLESLNVLDERLLRNEKDRSLSLFGHDLDKRETYFGDVYSANYEASLAYLAQAQRHRTIDYKMEFLNNDKYFVPPILEDDKTLVNKWESDIDSVRNVTPQGLLVRVNETSSYDKFILKCKERLCSSAQLEIANKTKDILNMYKEVLEEKDHYLKDDIVKYSHGARCTFPDYKCTNDCKFSKGKRLIRKI